MPTITVNRKVIEKIINKKLPEKELKEKISYLGTDLEGMDEDNIHLEIFPNRPDMLSEQGFGRALSSFLGNQTGLRKYTAKDSKKQCIVSKDMKDIRPYTACCIVKNLNLDDDKIKEIIQVQEKLHVTFCRKRKKAAMGIYPMEKIKFPIYLKAAKPEEIVFRPLEFPREINARQILSQHPTGREYAHLVEGLDRYAYFEDSNKNILSFTPIINSHLTGRITEKTKEAFIEVSGFDLNICKMVLNILVTAFADMGAKIYSMEVVYPDKTITIPNLDPKKMDIDLTYVNKILGLDLDEKKIKVCLEKMGHGYKDKKALIPCYRADVLHQIDLIEDISIAYGFENFTPEIPNKSTIGHEDKFEKFKDKISRLLIGLGLIETSTYQLTSVEEQTKMMKTEYDIIELANALTIDYNSLRYWTIPTLLKVLKENKHNEYPQNIFDIGYIFRKDKNTETGIIEKNTLAIMICSKEAGFTEIRQILDYVLESLDIPIKIKEDTHPSFIEGRFGKVYSGKQEIGLIGEVHPQILENFELDMPVAALEIDLEALFELIR